LTGYNEPKEEKASIGFIILAS